MSDLKDTIKMIMKYISTKQSSSNNKDLNTIKSSIKKDLFFKNQVGLSLEKSHSNENLNETYQKYKLHLMN